VKLRNPLAAISNAMQLLSGGVTAAQRAFVDEVIGRQVAVLRQLVDDLLDLSRIAHGQIGLQKEHRNQLFRGEGHAGLGISGRIPTGRVRKLETANRLLNCR